MINGNKAAPLSALAFLAVFFIVAAFASNNSCAPFLVEVAGLILGDNEVDVRKEATVNGKDVTVKTAFYDSSLDEPAS